MAYSFPGVRSTQQSCCCTCHLVHQQLQVKRRLQLSNLTAHRHVSSIKRPAALLVSGRASPQSTATKRHAIAQPTGHEDKEVHGSPRGAVMGRQASLSDKSQKRKRGVFLTESEDELSVDCSPLVQSQQAAKPHGALTKTLYLEPKTKRLRSRFTGVSWNQMVSKWEAYVYESYVKPNQKKGFKKRVLGYFTREEDAAKAADKGRIQNGQKAVNSEEMTGQ